MKLYQPGIESATSLLLIPTSCRKANTGVPWLGWARPGHHGGLIDVALGLEQPAILGGEVVDGVARGEMLSILGGEALFHIDGELNPLHLSVDLGDAILFDPITGVHPIPVDIKKPSKGVIVLFGKGQDIFSICLLERPGASVNGHHTNLPMGPFLEPLIGK